MAEVPLGPTQTPKTNTFRERLSSAASSAANQVRGFALKGLGTPTEPQYNTIASQLNELVNKKFDDVSEIKELFKDRFLIETALKVFQQRLVYLNNSFSKVQEKIQQKIQEVEINIEYAKIIKKNIDKRLIELNPELFDENGVLKPLSQPQSSSGISYNSFTDPQMVMLMQNIDIKALIEGLGHMVTLGAVAVGHIASAALTSRGGKKRHKRSRRITKKIDKRKIKTHKRKGKSRKNKKSKGRKNK
jgi:hypothetical protein